MERAYKVVGVISSAREGSFSAAMVMAALEGAKAAGAVTELIELPKKSIEFCTGCLKCMKAGKCWKDDDFAGVKSKLTQADAIVWGSPVYAGAPNAIMKNLIDRLGMLEVTTSSLGGKYMAGIAAAKSAGVAKRVAKGLSRFGIGGTFARSYSSAYLGEGFSRGRTFDETAAKNAKRLGENLVRDIRAGRRYALQGLMKRILSGLVMKRAFSKYIMNNKDGDAKALYESLKSRGLLA